MRKIVLRISFPQFRARRVNIDILRTQRVKSVTSFIDEQTELLQQTRLHITDYVGKNEENFRNKHLMWKTPQDHFEWIELTVAPSMKSKSLFSEKETAISINDNTFRRNNESINEQAPIASTPFLTNLI